MSDTESASRHEPKPRSSWLAYLNRTFVRGLVAILPIVLTFYLLWWTGSTAETWLGGLLKRVIPDGWYRPGMGLAAGVIVIFAVGLVLRGWVTRYIVARGERIIERIPLVKTIYGAVKDLMGFFESSDTKDRLSKVVLVNVAGTSDLIGFLTREDASALTKRDADSDRVAVYLPMSYQIGGFLVVVPRESVTPLDISVEEGLRLAITAGVRSGS